MVCKPSDITQVEYDAETLAWKMAWLSRAQDDLDSGRLDGGEAIAEPLYPYEGLIAYDPLFPNGGYFIFGGTPLPTVAGRGWADLNGPDLPAEDRKRAFLTVYSTGAAVTVTFYKGFRGGTYALQVPAGSTGRIGPFILRDTNGGIAFRCSVACNVQVACEVADPGIAYNAPGNAPDLEIV